MKKLLLLAALVFIGFLQCRQAEKKEETDQMLPEDFEIFYDKFHEDSTFQLSHIQFPLEGAKEASGGTVDLMVPVKWNKEDWTMHKTFNAYGGTFKREFYQIGPVVIEKIHDKGGYFSMERRFTKMNGEWILIYYSVTN